MRAAVAGGADAVYFGLRGLNARASAENFDEAALAGAMLSLHEHGVKGYVTLNTLVFDDELPEVERAVRACAAAGADAVIVQDLGVLRLVRAIAPDLRIHASTQMTCTDASSVRLAGELGAARVVLARELSMDDIARIAEDTDVELEVFVHGALCIATSGQCLTSEAIGGRSANRGACAQACRLPYRLVVDGEVQDLGDAAYLLSPEDLEAVALVPRLAALGVHALKIEGRLKGHEYVYATARLYREAVAAACDAGPTPPEEHKRSALLAYTRGSGHGFLDGVDHQRLVDGETCDHRGLVVGDTRDLRVVAGKQCVLVRLTDAIARGDGLLLQGGFAGEGEVGGRVWEIFDTRGSALDAARAGQEVLVWLGPDRSVGDVRTGRRVFCTNDPANERALRHAIEHEAFRAPLALRVHGALGARPTFEATSVRDGRTATVVGEAPIERAHGQTTTRAVLEDKLGALGGSPFALASLDVDLPVDAFLPLGSLKRARRALVEALATQAARTHATTERHAVDLLAEANPPDRAPPPPGVFVLCRTQAQAEAAHDAGATGIVLDLLQLAGTGEALRALRARGAQVAVALPRVRKPGEDKIDMYLRSLEPDAVLVRGLGALGEGSAFPAVGDFSLNVTNRLSAAEVLGRGLAVFTPAFDLDAAQLEALLTSAFAPFAEVVAFHPMPLFYMQHCLFAARLSEGRDDRTCGRPCEHHTISLRDRTGIDHPVEADVACRNTVFHAKAQSAIGLVPRLLELGVRRFRIELVRESPDDVRRIVPIVCNVVAGHLGADDAWRALRADNGYGVVRGSLRVIA